MTNLAHLKLVPEHCEDHVQQLATRTAKRIMNKNADRILKLVELNQTIHERDCFNLNPATNVVNPKAEAVLADGLGYRPSLGYTGDEYEVGLEAIEQIDVIAAELCA